MRNNKRSRRKVCEKMAIVQTDVVYTSQRNENTIQELKKKYPFLEIGVIGYSVLRVPISFIKIGGGTKKVFYNGSFHANEWITSIVLLKFVEELAEALLSRRRFYGVDLERLFRKVTLYVVPMVNPDGVDVVNGAIKNDTVLRSVEQIADNYPMIPYPKGWKANIRGVDLNRQFPAEWNQARATKFAQGFTSFAPRDFVGEGPLTEPESLAVYDFTLEHNFDLILAYHTQGEVIYWKFLNYEPPRSREIAMYFGQVSGYAVELTPEASGYAGYKDWFIQNYNRPGYTIEVGQGMNPLPLSQFPRIYEDNIGILLGGMTEV